MITIETPRGKIHIANTYFQKLIGDAASSCYGVAGMVSQGSQALTSLFRRNAPEKGIRVKGNQNAISVDLHIMVMYGLNISAIAQSIVHKVKYTVEASTGLSVDRVTVHVDGMKI